MATGLLFKKFCVEMVPLYIFTFSFEQVVKCF